MNLVKAPYFIERRMGLVHLIDQSNTIDKNLVIKGGWELKQLEYFSSQIKSLLNNGKTIEFWDIGAHSGLYSIYLAKHCGLELIHAFEPDPRSHAQLHANLFLNKLTTRIKVHNVAAADVDEDITFYMADDKGRGGSRIGKSGDAKIAGETIVRAQRLDNYLQTDSDILAMKIDVEGHEQRVFDGMPKLLRESKILLQLELFEDNQQKMISFLRGYGFKLVHTIDFDHYFSNFEMAPVTKDT